MNQNHTENFMEAARGETNPGHFDINKVDYQWIEKNRNVKELKQAYRTLEADGYFPDLLKKCGERIAEFDQTWARRLAPESKLSYEETKAINDDLDSFFSGMSKTDEKLRHLNNNDDQENISINANGNAA